MRVAVKAADPATGFALAGARLHGDRPTYQALFRTASLCGAPLRTGGRHRFVVGGSLGNAILLAMMTAGPGSAVSAGPFVAAL